MEDQWQKRCRAVRSRDSRCECWQIRRGGGLAMHPASASEHPRFSRRTLLQAGSVGLLGLGMNHVNGLRALAKNVPAPKAHAAIFIFLSGGLAQQDSFDLKPDAAQEYRGEFRQLRRAHLAFRFASIYLGWPSAAICGPWCVR